MKKRKDRKNTINKATSKDKADARPMQCFKRHSRQGPQDSRQRLGPALDGSVVPNAKSYFHLLKPLEKTKICPVVIDSL